MLYKTEYITKDNIRAFLHFLKREYNTSKPLRCAEVGVEFGTNALNMLQTLNIGWMYLIDPYSAGQYQCDNQDTLNKAKSHAYTLLEPYKDKIRWIHEPSLEAIKHINSFLDFAYLDDLHTHNYLCREIPMWYQVISHGGYLIGHDYIRCGSKENMSVSDAIHEIVAKTGADACISSDVYADWWIRKDQLTDLTVWY